MSASPIFTPKPGLAGGAVTPWGKDAWESGLNPCVKVEHATTCSDSQCLSMLKWNLQVGPPKSWCNLYFSVHFQIGLLFFNFAANARDLFLDKNEKNYWIWFALYGPWLHEQPGNYFIHEQGRRKGAQCYWKSAAANWKVDKFLCSKNEYSNEYY